MVENIIHRRNFSVFYQLYQNIKNTGTGIFWSKHHPKRLRKALENSSPCVFYIPKELIERRNVTLVDDIFDHCMYMSAKNKTRMAEQDSCSAFSLHPIITKKDYSSVVDFFGGKTEGCSSEEESFWPPVEFSRSKVQFLKIMIWLPMRTAVKVLN